MIRFVQECQPLADIYHVCHFDTGLRILEDGQVSAGLVRDRSKLNTERILVAWLSPNKWTNGYRYGNLRFRFDWRDIIKDKQFYWVESITYKPPAPRLLVTDKDRSGLLQSYDPTSGDGPWWHDTTTDQHYWNGNFTLEVMYEGNLSSLDWKGIDFVDHHNKMCNIDPKTCAWKGKTAGKFGPRFVAALVARRIPSDSLDMVRFDGSSLDSSCPLRRTLVGLYYGLVKRLDESGRLVASTAEGAEVARAMLAAFAAADDAELKHLGDLFESKQEARDACFQTIAQHFKINDWKVLLEDWE